MPEAKNTFLKAKMNQDLDDRLLPNGEYRTAQNVLVGKSEEDSVGTLQNIKGNEILDSLTRPANSFIIGYLMDTTKNRIYAFFTDNANNHSIRYHNINSTDPNPIDWITLVEGAFLNFSPNFPILNINLLEDLLFWTDNYNQPRKINVTHSLGYYTEEHQISVAKYNPYEPISLVKQEIEEVVGTSTATVFDVTENAGITEGMIVLSKNGVTPVITADNYITVSSVSTTGGTTTVTLSSAASSITAGDVMYFLSSTMTDQSDNAAWPGDPSYLESKFVRFSYRFKFDDNEYSIFAPFTQVAFIPKQKGYFVNGQEEAALSSTILDWFENGINNIDLIIPLPDSVGNISNNYKIKEIDILYKESDQIPVKVIDTIFPPTTGTDNYYIYNYQSRKPIRTLPEAQTVRVYDKVPVVANTQEIVSNRVVYGNFKTKLTPPRTINYTVNIQKKISQGAATSFVEYPNHTVKQNRNYQVGFVLSDKYGRQSDVILSPISESSTDKGSTIFAPYISDDPAGSGTPNPNYYNDLRNWYGNSLILNLLSPITTISPQTPLYATAIGNGFNIDTAYPVVIDGNTYRFTLSGTDTAGIPQEGYYMRGNTKDYVKITTVTPFAGAAYEVITDGQVSNVYLKNTEIVSSIEDTKFAYTINVNGWYSYKIVVKQTEQEYYNVYLPSAIGASGFTTSTDTSASVSYITLINDNINKVPRDLAEVGPDQKQYRSSVELFGRVQPNVTGTSPSFVYGNNQYFPTRTADTSTAVGNTDDLVGELANASPDLSPAVFQYDSDPILARVTTNKQFGVDAADLTGADRFQLAVYETEPVVSNLDIYWETSHAGLISDLNSETLSGFSGPVQLDGWVDLLNENLQSTNPASGGFVPKASDGTNITNYTVELDSAVDANNSDVTDKFSLNYNILTSEWYIQLDQELVFEQNSPTRDIFTFAFTVRDNFPESTWGTAQFSETLTLSNTTPSFDAQATSPSLDYYYFFEDSTTSFSIRNFLTQNNALNGSAGTSINQNELVWSISGPDVAKFQIGATTGILTPTTAGVAAGFNTYEVDVTLKDANGSADGDSVTQTYKIIKGFTPSNITPSYQSPAGPFQQSLGDNYPNIPNTPNTREFIYYIAAGDPLEESELPGDPNISATFIKKFGGQQALTAGAIQFGVEDIYASQGGTSNYGFKLEVQPYYRSNSNSPWLATSSTATPPRDLNNREFTTQFGPVSTTVTNTTTSPPTYKSNIFYAQDTPGEYAWVVTVSRVQVSGPLTYMFVNFKGVLRDLHYTNTQFGGLRVYRYRLFDNNGAGYSSPPGTLGNYTQYVYSEQPLAEYNTKFWTNTDLSTVYIPPVNNKYYIVQLDTQPAISDREFSNYSTQGNLLLGAAILSKPGGEVVRNNQPNVITLEYLSNGTIITASPIGRSGDFYSWP
jgi:hypothetical protein